MTKHEAVKEFFEQKVEEIAEKQLGFNFSDDTEDNISIITNYSALQLKKYFIGAEKEYGFSIIIVKEYSTDEDDLNIQAMNFAQSFMDWLEEQNKNKNYPDFGENCMIKKMENLQNMPNLAGILPEANLARYMLQCRIIYFEK